MNKIKQKNGFDFFCKDFFVQLCGCAFIGVVCGFLGALFHYALEFAEESRLYHKWLIYFLPAAGILIIFLFLFFKLDIFINKKSIYTHTRHNKKIPFALAPVIFISTFLTHFFGGSAGREGAAVSLGGSIGSQISEYLGFQIEKRYLFAIAGMSAAFSAMLGTPFAGSVFALESMYVYRHAGFRKISYSWVHSVIASLFAFIIAKLMKVNGLGFGEIQIPSFETNKLFLCVLLVLCSIIIAVIFRTALRYAEKLFKKIGNPYIRIFCGALFVVIISLALGTDRYNGAGTRLITAAFSGNALVYDFLLKILLTVLTMSCGFCGGEMIPSIVIGSAFGFTFSKISGLDLGISVAVSMICVFGAFLHAPITSFIIAFEIFGYNGWYYFIISAAINCLYTISSENLTFERIIVKSIRFIKRKFKKTSSY